MSLKRKIALIGGGLLFFVLLLVSVLSGIYFYLPHYLEAKVIPRLAADAGISDFAVDVRDIGFFGADLGSLRMGPPENPALVVRSVQVDYSPRSLYHQKIEKITLSGIELYGEISDGEFKLRGLEFQKLVAGLQQREKQAATPDETRPALAVAKLEIRSSQVIIGYNNHIFSIPVEIDVVPQDFEFNRIKINARLNPLGQELTATAEVTRVQNRAAVNIDFKNLNLGCLADVIPRPADFTLSGEADIHGRAEVFWAPFRLASTAASLTLRRMIIRAGELKFQNFISSQNQEIPLKIDLAGNGDNHWQVTAGRMSMTAPMPLTLSAFEGSISKNAAAFESTGGFSIVLQAADPPGEYPLPVKIPAPMPMQGRFSAEYHHSGKWQCEISNDKSPRASAKPFRLTAEPYSLTLSPPDFYLKAEAASGKIEAAYKITAPKVHIESDSDAIYIPQVVFSGTAGLTVENEAVSRITFDLQAPNADLKSGGAAIKIAEMSVSGKLNRNESRRIGLDGVMQFSGADGKFSGLNARLTGARGKIPFKWPVEGKAEKGSVSIAQLIYNNMNLGGMTAGIWQTPTGFAFEGRHKNKLVPDLKLDFNGESRLFNVASAGSKVRVEVSRPGNGPAIDLGRFFPQAKGFQINGQFELNGDFVLDRHGFSGRLRAGFNEGRLVSTPNKLTLEGIRLSLNFPELPRIRTAPAQRIQFGKLSLGDLIAEKGTVDFQIESARAILIEQMHFMWCEGHVETQSMRWSPGIEDYRITFYCDRLNLAMVLAQFGAAAAEGRGTVNGRIPLQYANGKISFDDGFLYSTPGDGGKIRVTGSEILTAGVPPDTPQYVQMELASEALKDYDYTWAKLNITSQGEELLLKMQMDGKPAKTLPFVYRKDIGGFVKVEADAKGSKFQGIRLDVNFRLPLNKLLQYKDLINMIKKSD